MSLVIELSPVEISMRCIIYILGKKFWPQFSTAQQKYLLCFKRQNNYMTSLTHIHFCMSHFFVKIQPILGEYWAVKATKVCKNETQVWLSLTSLWSPCLAARPLPKWQECTRLGCVHSVSSDAMGICARTVRGIVYDSKAQRKPRTCPTTIRKPRKPFATSGTWGDQPRQGQKEIALGKPIVCTKT